MSTISHGQFMSHGYCLLWQPSLVWSSVVSDLIITLAYYSIPLALAYFVKKRTDFEHRWILSLFAAFILLCGTTHLLGAIIIWKPLYYLDVTVKAVTALVSVFTAVIMWPLIPKLLALPSHDEVVRANSALQAEISARKELEKVQSRFSAFVNSSTDAIISKTLDGIVTSWNPAAEKMFGYAAQEIIGQPVTMVIPSELIDEEKRILGEISRGGAHYETLRKRKNGKSFPAFITISPLKDEAGTIIGVSKIVHDITERTEIEAGLEKTRKELAAIKISADEAGEYAESIINTVREPLIALDKNLRVVKVSRSFYDFFKVKPEETMGQLIYDLGNKQWDIPKLRELLETILPQRTSFDNYEVEHDFATIGRRTMLLNARQIERVLGMDRVILLAIEDITERKAADKKLQEAKEELEVANEELRSTNEELDAASDELKVNNGKLERANQGLQEFTYVASHDLQEPLRKVSVFGDRLKQHLGPALDEKGADYLARMTSASERMSQLIKDLLELSSVTSRAKPFEPVDLSALLREVVDDLEVSFKEAGAVVIAGLLPVIQADRTQMRQLLQNLIGNGVKYRRPEVPCRITVQAAPNDAERILNGKLYAAGETLLISVEDNGIGFEQKYAERIFGVFQRLHGKAEYKGTGVGLAICKKIVARHGGEIEASSKAGEGSRFTVILPIANKTMEGK